MDQASFAKVRSGTALTGNLGTVKTKMCRNHEKGDCWWGERCCFAHSSEELGTARDGNVVMKFRTPASEQALFEMAAPPESAAPPEADFIEILG